jgi:thymidylate synthase (FAD)
MNIVEQSFEIIDPTTDERLLDQARVIERAGRNCYKSEDLITPDSFKKFCKMLRSKKHEAMLEFGHMTVRFVTNRGVSHEIVRHRLASYAQESTRYCNYGKEKFGSQITVVRPIDWETISDSERKRWEIAMRQAEAAYFGSMSEGAKPQWARRYLPNELKTEIFMSADFREWRHFFKMRLSPAAHPDIRALVQPLYDHVFEILPEVFKLDKEISEEDIRKVLAKIDEVRLGMDASRGIDEVEVMLLSLIS